MVKITKVKITNRRRTLRHPTRWSARYMIDTRPDGWYECHVLDVSLGGAALAVFGPAPEPDARMRIELRTAADSTSGLQLRGVARNLGAGDGTSGIRVGVEWHALTHLEEALLAVLIEQPPALIR